MHVLLITFVFFVTALEYLSVCTFLLQIVSLPFYVRKFNNLIIYLPVRFLHLKSSRKLLR